MGWWDTLVVIGMEVSVHEFSWVGAYLACGCNTSDDEPLSNVSGWKVVRELSNGEKEIQQCG